MTKKKEEIEEKSIAIVEKVEVKTEVFETKYFLTKNLAMRGRKEFSKGEISQKDYLYILNVNPQLSVLVKLEKIKIK